MIEIMCNFRKIKMIKMNLRLETLSKEIFLLLSNQLRNSSKLTLYAFGSFGPFLVTKLRKKDILKY